MPQPSIDNLAAYYRHSRFRFHDKLAAVVRPSKSMTHKCEMDEEKKLRALQNATGFDRARDFEYGQTDARMRNKLP